MYKLGVPRTPTEARSKRKNAHTRVQNGSDRSGVFLCTALGIRRARVSQQQRTTERQPYGCILHLMYNLIGEAVWNGKTL